MINGFLGGRNWMEGKLLLSVAILLFLPFSYRLSSIAIGLLFCFAIASIILNKKKLSFYKKYSFWLPSIFVIISLIGLGYTSNMPLGLGIIETQISLVTLAFIFSELGISNVELDRLKTFYISLLLLLVLVLECRVLWLLTTSTEHDFFSYFFSYYYTYSNLTTNFVVQPVYLGTFIILSNIFCLTLLVKRKKVRGKILFFVIMLVNTFFLFQLSARSSILLNLLIIVLYVFYIFNRQKKLIKGTIIVGSILLVSGVLFQSSGFTRLRMQGFLSELTAENLRLTDSKSRILIWSCAGDIILENKILGVGTGDAEDALKEKYQERGLMDLYAANLNAHNQFLTLIMRHGFMGFFALIFALSFTLYWFYKTKNIEAVLFMLLITGFFLTENVLNRAQGVIFFAFFQSIFLEIAFRDE